MNKIILIGNLTKDPDLQTTGNGTVVCRFSIAVGRNFANSDGERETDFFNCVAWRSLGETVGKFLKKGSKCSIVGSVQNRTYEDSHGDKKFVTEIIADEVEFLTPKKDDEPKKAKQIVIDDEDLPF